MSDPPGLLMPILLSLSATAAFVIAEHAALPPGWRLFLAVTGLILAVYAVLTSADWVFHVASTRLASLNYAIAGPRLEYLRIVSRLDRTQIEYAARHAPGLMLITRPVLQGPLQFLELDNELIPLEHVAWMMDNTDEDGFLPAQHGTSGGSSERTWTKAVHTWLIENNLADPPAGNQTARIRDWDAASRSLGL